MKKMLICIFLIAIVGSFGCSSASNPEAEAKAITAATDWLALVDGEKYEESWDESSQLFQGGISKEQWVQAMQAVRKPFGKKISRELKSQHYRTALPGAPDGEYVVIQFNASFENKQVAVETITPMLGKDGQWRISGYFMK
jgi:hypothetical protein